MTRQKKIRKQFVKRKVTSHTPSFVQVQLVHGKIFLDDPSEMSNPFTLHCVTSALQWLKSMSGKDLHGTRGFL